MNNPRDLADEANNVIAQRSSVNSMDDPPTFAELHTAILNLQSGKTPGRVGIPELWEFGGVKLVNCLHKLIAEIWDVQKLL